jgi:hypothetical protein
MFESMKGCRTWMRVAAIAALVIVAGRLLIAPLSARAASPPSTPPSLPSSPSLPPPHLGYGMNVRDPATVESLFAPLGFDWLKLWEEYGTEENPTLPQIRYPYRVLFLVDCTKKSNDLDAWGDAVEAIATAGKGLVEAYEICNEPNLAEWLGTHESPDQPPDPGLYVAMLQVAYERIKAIDPAAIVVSAGLAPVGRIQGTCNGWSGNDCNAMDEREYARQMILLGAGDYLDAFGYHPYGFAYEPERALNELPPDDDGNGFAFRGVEVMHDLLEQHGLDDKLIWATEFSWLREPREDGGDAWWCHRRDDYEDTFGWMDVPEVQQADYLTRAFQYADENWPWMGPMFVWNLDWYDYGWLCDPARYFSVLKIDYTDYHPLMDFGELVLFAEYSASLSRGRPMQREAALDDQPAPYTTTLSYEALVAMEKRPVGFGPRLAIEPPALTFLADVDEPGPLTRVVVPLNAGFGVFTWTATVAVGMQVTPTLAITTGLQGTPLTVTVDSTGYSTGTFTGAISVTSTTTGVLGAPQAVPVTLLVVPEVYGVYLPLALRFGP